MSLTCFSLFHVATFSILLLVYFRWNLEELNDMTFKNGMVVHLIRYSIVTGLMAIQLVISNDNDSLLAKLYIELDFPLLTRKDT